MPKTTLPDFTRDDFREFRMVDNRRRMPHVAFCLRPHTASSLAGSTRI